MSIDSLPPPFTPGPPRRREHSVENLYFDAWLRTYSALSSAEPYSAESAAQLADSFSFAMAAFLHPSSLLELNTTAAIRTDLNAAVVALPARALGGPAPTPAAFLALHAEVRDALRVSLARFVCRQQGNIGTRRSSVALVVGTVQFLLGWVPCVAGALLTEQRAWRAVGLPFFLFGAWIFYCGWNNVSRLDPDGKTVSASHSVWPVLTPLPPPYPGASCQTCLMIFAIGGSRTGLSRQLWPYELALRRYETSPSPLALTHTRSRSILDDVKLASPALPDSPVPPSPAAPSAPPVHILHLPGTHNISPPSTSPPRFPLPSPPAPFGLAHFPLPDAREGRPPHFPLYEVAAGGADGLDWSGPGPGVWAPMTVVENVEIREWQGGVVRRGAAVGAVAIAVCGAVALAVPGRGQ